MTDDEREDLSATLVAHELLLQFVLQNLLQIMPDNQRQAMLEAILNMPGLQVPEGIARDFDAADRLAGIAQKVEQHMKRIVTGSVGNTGYRDGSAVGPR